MPRSLASLRGPPSTLLPSSSHLELQPEKDSIELESQEHSLQHELVTTKEICQQLLKSINSLGNVPGGMNINDPFLILLHQVCQDDTVPHYSADELPNVKYFWKANFLRDHRNGRGYLKTVRNDDSGTLGFLEDVNGVVTSKDEQQRFRDYTRPLLHCLQKFGYAPPTWAKVSSPALEFFARSMRIKFSAFCYCADNWKADMFMSMYYPGWTGRSRDSEGVTLDIKEESSTPMLPTEMIPQKRPQSISLPLTPQFTKKKKEVQLETPLSGSSGSSSHIDLTVADQNSPANVVQDDNLIDDAYKRIKIVPVIPPPQINPALAFEREPELATQPVGSQASVLRQLLGGLNSANLTEINVIASDPMLAPATPVSHPRPSPVSTAMAVSETGAKKKRSVTDRNSTMRASQTSTTPRNLCAIDWCKEHKGGTVGEFADYWDTLVRNNHPSVEEYKRKATMVKEMRKNAMQSMSSSTVSVHISNGGRSSNPEALNIPSAVFDV